MAWHRFTYSTYREIASGISIGQAVVSREFHPADWMKRGSRSACIDCHTTGPEKKPGIQCEACHGAGKAYSNPKIMNRSKWKTDPEKQCAMAVEAGLVKAPGETNCTSCHNEKSPTYVPFDFKKRYEEVKHPE